MTDARDGAVGGAASSMIEAGLGSVDAAGGTVETPLRVVEQRTA